MVCRDPNAPITIYHIGNAGEKEHWWDLCAGPHVASTGAIDPAAVEIERTAGAYWRGDETRAMLTRVYGTAWQSETQLRAYHHMLEEAARRDHRKLGTQLQLFSIQVRACGKCWQRLAADERIAVCDAHACKVGRKEGQRACVPAAPLHCRVVHVPRGTDAMRARRRRRAAASCSGCPRVP